MMAPAPAPGKDPDPAIAAALGGAASLPSRPPASAISARSKSAIAANPDDHQARFDLAVALNAKGDRDGAADRLLEIIKRDRAGTTTPRASSCCSSSKPGA